MRRDAAAPEEASVNRMAGFFPDFAEFFRAVTADDNGPRFDPLPWQAAAAERYVADGRLPDAITVPTGMGKTSVMLVHLYALALDVHRHGPAGRTVPLRCFHLVERRVVVDEAARTAKRAADAVDQARRGDTLWPVREALVQLIPPPMRGFEPIVATESLHGRRPRRADPRAWLRPVGALLVTATVTQVVSRALFHGVGVSWRMAPMHAAIAGMDRLVLVDEPHLSVPGVTALRESEAVQRAAPVSLGVRVGQTVTLGATIPEELLAAGNRLDINAADRAHPVASRLLNAPRTLRFHTVTPATGTAAHTAVEKAMARGAAEAYRADRVRGDDAAAGDAGVLVFCNTVAATRRIADLLDKAKTPMRVVHGRFREGDQQVRIDRDAVTVATQTLEVGADLDGVHVITQCPSLAALVQRAGRCNRRGRLATAFVDVYAAGAVDPGTAAVYGEYASRLRDTLAQLVPENGLDMSPTGLETLVPALKAAADGPLDPPPPRTAVLSTQVAEYAAYTSERYTFPTAAFLYGPDTPREDDVRVAWRAEGLDLLNDIPVMKDETVAVPLEGLRDILRRADGMKVQDRGDGDTEATTVAVNRTGRRVSQDILAKVRVMGADNCWKTPADLTDITPGIAVVLAADLGGYTVTGGVDPADATVVPDISELVARHRGDGRWLLPQGDLARDLLDSLLDDPSGQGARRMAADALDISAGDEDPGLDVLLLADDTRVGIIDRTRAPARERPDKDDIVTLDDHSYQVGTWTAATASVLPLPSAIADRLTAAGHAHDVGKADRRFQIRLGNLRFAGGGAAWAKSRRRYTAVYDARLLAQSGLPAEWRHEMLSADGIDDCLTRHIVLAHHGRARPLVFHEREVCTGHVDVFDTLTSMYGPWGLALLETVMRWADHRASRYPESFSGEAPAIPVTRTENLTITRNLTRFDAGAAGWTVTDLPGASSSPLAGTLGAVGLLALLRDREDGDPDALLRWNPTTGVPQIASRKPLPDLLRIVRPVQPWQSIDDHVRTALGVKDGIRVKYHKFVPTTEIDKRIALAHPGFSLLIHDTTANYLPKWEMRSVPYANNGKGFAAAFLPATAEVFLDPAAGFDKSGEVSGGGVDIAVDRYGKDPVRTDMLAWALDGYLALGWSPTVRGSRTARNSRLEMARPPFWVTPRQYRALTLSTTATARMPHGAWLRARVADGINVWQPTTDGSDSNMTRTE